jgi:Nif-specific regulatory protein
MNDPAAHISKDVDSPAFWREQEMLLLQNVMSLVGKSLSPSVVSREILRFMSELLGLNRGRVVLKDAEGGTCRIQHAYGLPPTEIAQGVYRLDEGITGHVLTHGHLVLVQDIDKSRFKMTVRYV